MFAYVVDSVVKTTSLGEVLTVCVCAVFSNNYFDCYFLLLSGVVFNSVQSKLLSINLCFFSYKKKSHCFVAFRIVY